MGRSLVLTVTREPKLLFNFVFCLEKHSGLPGYYFMLLCRSETVEATEIFFSFMKKKWKLKKKRKCKEKRMPSLC